MDPNLLNRPIEEQVFQAPGVDNEKHPLQDPDSNKVSQNGQKKPEPEPIDPGLKDLPPGQKQAAAEQLVGLCLRGYEKLHELANKRLQISDRKIINLQAKGLINLSVPVPYTLTEMMPLGEFITEYNKDMGNLLSIDPEWRAEIEPPLVRIFQKRGLGLSDEGFVISMLVADMTVKTQRFFAAKSKTDSVLQFAREQTALMYGAVPMRPSPPPPAPPTGPVGVPSPPAPVVDMHNVPGATAAAGAGISQPAASGIPIQDHVMGTGTTPVTGAMASAVQSSSMPNWGENAEKLNKRSGGRKPGSKNKPKKRA